MEITQQPANLLRVIKKEGVSKKSGNGYLFSTATLLVGADVYEMNLSDEIWKNADLLSEMEAARNVPVFVDISIVPKGKFDISAQIEKLTFK